MQTQTDSERRRAQRERTAKSRAKKKEQAVIAAAADEERRFQEFNFSRTEQRLVTPGEREAFINAESVEDALQVAREFLVALNQPEVHLGETLLDVERRAVSAWCAAGAGLLNRNTLRIDTSTASTTDGFTFDFDSRWIPLDGANEVIDISTLAAIEVPAVPAAVDSPTVEVAPTIEDIAAKELAIRVAAICKAQQDACDADARRISAKNLQRELEKEKRLGI